MQYVAGSVPYVNAKPLVSQFEHLRESSPVQVLYQVPSKLPALLDSGTAHAVLVSSFDSLCTPGRKIAAGTIATFGDAQSVRLFSRKPFEDVGTLALDASSLTSVHLAQIVMIERYGVRPRTVNMAPDLDQMLEECDAAVLIGDKGMLADGTGLRELDLGREWTELTGLPFVWAAWTGGEGLTPELAGHLERAKDWGMKHLEHVVRETQAECRWPGDSCRVYLTEIMNYDLSERHLDGLRAFQQMLLTHGYLTENCFPNVVRGGVAAV